MINDNDGEHPVLRTPRIVMGNCSATFSKLKGLIALAFGLLTDFRYVPNELIVSIKVRLLKCVKS